MFIYGLSSLGLTLISEITTEKTWVLAGYSSKVRNDRVDAGGVSYYGNHVSPLESALVLNYSLSH